jgi:hypothetical protein
MPTNRKPNEDKDAFIQRCMKETYDEFPDNSQRYAVCVSYADKNTQMGKDIFVLVPRKAENRGEYLKRCARHPRMKEQFGNIKERMGYCLTSFNEYYKYWSKIADDFAEVPSNTNLGACITKKKAQGLDYKNAYAQCASKVVVPTGTIVLNEDNLLVEPVEFGEMNIAGYSTKNFDMCPGAQETFKHILSMNPDSETIGMVRSAAQVADNIFGIEKQVIDEGDATQEQLNEARILVDDFYDIMHEIDEELGMVHDVKYMEGHLEKIMSYMSFGLEDACWEGYEAIGTKIVDGKEVPNCVPIKES